MWSVNLLHRLFAFITKEYLDFMKIFIASMLALATFCANAQNFDSTGTNRLFAPDINTNETVPVEGYGNRIDGTVLTGTRYSTFPMHHLPAYFICIVKTGGSGGVPPYTSPAYSFDVGTGQPVHMACPANTVPTILNPEQASAGS